ncbi:hypothetical protein IC235_06705 [Hymenobacter sp. BT664]|uniref:Uncharacterized protein n=2 Tax=Hymenobacter montanus TaxID=2771359 RepID=A0A927BCH0_9BACT|nr:hypothetical protein [Hymenobacter montanus]
MEIIIRKSYLFWSGEAYKYGGFGQIIDKYFSASDADILIKKLTIHFLRNINPKIKDYIFSNNNYTKDIALLKEVSAFFRQEFQLDFENDFWYPPAQLINKFWNYQIFFPFPFYSIIEKVDDIFYINELNNKFWSQSEISAIKNSDWDFTILCLGLTGPVKQIYNDIETAKKDGTKKMLYHLIREDHQLFNKLTDLKKHKFINEWHNETEYYTEILPNNLSSRKTDEIIEKIKETINIEDIFETKEISFEEAKSFEDIM